MADDVAGFIEEHSLKDTTLIGHSMGAKTAMTLALRSPDIVADIVSVDNAPLDTALGSNFGKYIQGMRKIEESGVTKQAEADSILKDYEEVSFSSRVEVRVLNSCSRYRSDNSCSVTYTDYLARRYRSSKSRFEY